MKQNLLVLDEDPFGANTMPLRNGQFKCLKCSAVNPSLDAAHSHWSAAHRTDADAMTFVRQGDVLVNIDGDVVIGPAFPVLLRIQQSPPAYGDTSLTILPYNRTHDLELTKGVLLWLHPETEMVTALWPQP